MPSRPECHCYIHAEKRSSTPIQGVQTLLYTRTILPYKRIWLSVHQPTHSITKARSLWQNCFVEKQDISLRQKTGTALRLSTVIRDLWTLVPTSGTREIGTQCIAMITANPFIYPIEPVPELAMKKTLSCAIAATIDRRPGSSNLSRAIIALY